MSYVDFMGLVWIKNAEGRWVQHDGEYSAQEFRQYGHYNRNVRNVVPCTIDDAKALGFSKAPDWQNKYHRYEGRTDNEKWVRGDGSEVIFRGNGSIDNSIQNRGTFNFGKDPISHLIFDMDPYYVYGTTPYDPAKGAALIDEVLCNCVKAP